MRQPAQSEARGKQSPDMAYEGVMIAIFLLVLAVTRRDLAAYGLSLRNFGYHINIAAIAFVPVALCSTPLIFFDHKEWRGALIMAMVQIALIYALGWLLQRKPTRSEGGILAGGIALVACSNLAQLPGLANAISAFIFYLFFLGLGEELLFRG